MTRTSTRKPLRTAMTCLLAIGVAMTTMAARERPLEEVCNWESEIGDFSCFYDQQPLWQAPYWSLPEMAGSHKVGSVLTAVLPEGGMTFDVLTYQWLRDEIPIPGATNSTFKLTDAEIGKTMGLKVHGEVYPYEDASTTFTAETPVQGHSLVAGKPGVSGAKRVGSLLTVHPGKWTKGSKFSYRWLRNGVLIPGAGHHRNTRRRLDPPGHPGHLVPARNHLQVPVDAGPHHPDPRSHRLHVQGDSRGRPAQVPVREGLRGQARLDRDLGDLRVNRPDHSGRTLAARSCQPASPPLPAVIGAPRSQSVWSVTCRAWPCTASRTFTGRSQDRRPRHLHNC